MASLNEAFAFQNVPAYDEPDSIKPVFGYICKICNDSFNRHNFHIKKRPHPFVKGVYRQLLPYEYGPLHSN